MQHILITRLRSDDRPSIVASGAEDPPERFTIRPCWRLQQGTPHHGSTPWSTSQPSHTRDPRGKNTMGTWPGMARYDYNVPSFTKSLSWPPIHSGLWYHMVPIPAIMPCFKFLKVPQVVPQDVGSWISPESGRRQGSG